MAQDTVTNLAEVIAEVNALDEKIDGEVSRIDDEIGEVNSNLANRTETTDGEVYYPDKQDGKYGMNTDVERGADTFIPFSNGLEVVGWYTQKILTYTSGEKKQCGSMIVFKNPNAQIVFNATANILWFSDTDLPDNTNNFSLWFYDGVTIDNFEANTDIVVDTASFTQKYICLLVKLRDAIYNEDILVRKFELM